MKRKSACLFALFIALHIFSFSQERCGFDELHAKRMKADPAYRKRVAELEKNIQDFIKKNKNRLSAREMGTTAALYTIPVVVHVMHTGGAVGTIYNPSDAQIQGAIDYLNQVYNGTYPGTTGVGDLQIQFALAVRDPDCNATNGIDRVNASGIANYSTNGVNANTTGGTDEINIKNLSRWDPYDYYNIWVVDKIDGNDGTSGTFIAGFAYFPGITPSYDGTIMLATQMQSGKKTLPHEIGHAFGVYHTFQGGDATTCPSNADCTIDGDKVCDTDPVTLPSGFVCRTGVNSCTGTSYSSNTEENYMNYTNCYNLFTSGQKSRMLGAAGSIYRIGLSVSSALTSTNIAYPYSAPVNASCTPTTGATGMSGSYAGILGVQVSNKEYYSLIPSTDGGYLDRTTKCIKLVSLTEGGTYDFAALVNQANIHQLRAWIDYNNDGGFDNVTEEIHLNTFFGSSENYITSGTFLVPNSAVTNTVLRLRVIDDLVPGYPGTVSIADACHNPYYGQAEDYPVYIQSATILPVTLLSFTGQILGDKIVLNWSTTNEQDSKNFNVEKSTDGVSYYIIGRVNAAGNSTERKNYSFVDPDVAETNYYRIRMNNQSGQNKLSPVILISTGSSKQKLSILRNPFNRQIDISLSKEAKKVELQLVNINGNIVAQKTFSGISQQIHWVIPSQLSQGMYILRARVDEEIFSEKLIKD